MAALTPRQIEIAAAIDTGARDGRPWRLTLDIRGPVVADRLRLALDRVVPGQNPPPPPMNGSTRLDLTLSPLAFDRGSVAPLLRALAAAYAGTPAADGEVVDFARYAAWRDDLAQAPEAAAGRAYWRAQGGIAPRPPYRTAGPAAVGPEILDLGSLDLGILGRPLPDMTGLAPTLAPHGIPVDTALQAVWWMVVARITGRDTFQAWWRHDPRRDYDAFRDIVGVLEDWLPVAVSLDTGATVLDTLRHAAVVMDEHRAQQEYRLEATTDTRALGFAMSEAFPEVEAGGVIWSVSALPHPLEAVELAVDVTLANGAPVAAALHYDRALYDGQAMAALLDQYVTALSALRDHLDRPVRDLPLMGERDRHAHAALDQRTALPTPPSGVVETLLSWAARAPTAPALSEGADDWTYADLVRRVDHLARHLRHAGVAADRRVALVMPRGGAQVITLWAVLRAGGAYVPVDPAWPEARRQAALDAAAPHLVLTPDDVTRLADQPVADIDLPLPAPADAAYVIFTSGSTGTPKGVVVEHTQLAAYTAGVAQALDLVACRRFALTSSVAADLGNTTLFGAVAVGGCLVVADEAEMTEGGAFARFIRDRDIDCLKIVPSHLAALLDTAAPILPRTLVLGGERAPAALLVQVRDLAPATRVFNHYGPTETTVGVMVHALETGATPDGLPLSRVLAGSMVRVLDLSGQPTPLGAVGAVHIGGAQVSRGYLGRTADPAFIPDPQDPGGRLYRTGDLGYLHADGGLRLAGRADEQVKVRGYRVEPAEIEAAALALPGVRQAAVRPWGDGADLRLALYVVMDDAAREGGDRLRQALKNRLPDAMVPTRVLVLPALPRLGNGKIDRAALPEPAAPVTPPGGLAEDPVEDLLAGLVATLLERPAVGRSDNLFDLGAHSLLVIKLVARLRRRLGVEVTPALVFDHPTIADLAARLRALGADPEIARQAIT